MEWTKVFCSVVILCGISTVQGRPRRNVLMMMIPKYGNGMPKVIAFPKHMIDNMVQRERGDDRYRIAEVSESEESEMLKELGSRSNAEPEVIMTLEGDSNALPPPNSGVGQQTVEAKMTAMKSMMYEMQESMPGQGDEGSGSSTQGGVDNKEYKSMTYIEDTPVDNGPNRTGGCKIIGMFLPFPNDTCKYYTCQDKPWQDGGAASVIKTAMPCPHGQSVAEDYKGGYSNPCTVPSQRCSIPKNNTSGSSGIDTGAGYGPGNAEYNNTDEKNEMGGSTTLGQGFNGTKPMPYEMMSDSSNNNNNIGDGGYDDEWVKGGLGSDESPDDRPMATTPLPENGNMDNGDEDEWLMVKMQQQITHRMNVIEYMMHELRSMVKGLQMTSQTDMEVHQTTTQTSATMAPSTSSGTGSSVTPSGGTGDSGPTVSTSGTIGTSDKMADHTYPPEDIPLQPNGKCQKLGQYLPVVGSECYYCYCVYGRDPMGGNVSIQPKLMRCPDTLSVPPTYKPSMYSPCTGSSFNCKIVPDKPTNSTTVSYH